MSFLSFEDAALIGLGSALILSKCGPSREDNLQGGDKVQPVSAPKNAVSFNAMRDHSVGGGYPRVIQQKEYEVLSRGFSVSDLPAHSDPKTYEAELDQMLKDSIPQCVKGMSSKAFVPKETPMIWTSGKKLLELKTMTHLRSSLNEKEPDDSS